MPSHNFNTTTKLPSKPTPPNCSISIKANHLTRQNRSLLQMLIVPQLLMKFIAFYETRKFNTNFTRDRHLFLYWARLIQFTHPSPSLLLEELHLHYPPIFPLPSCFPNKKTLYAPVLSVPIRTTSRFPNWNSVRIFHFSHAANKPCLPPRLHCYNNILQRVRNGAPSNY